MKQADRFTFFCLGVAVIAAIDRYGLMETGFLILAALGYAISAINDVQRKGETP